MDQYAAEQLCHYLHELFRVNTEPSRQLSADSHLALIIGTPANNPLVARALAGAEWPAISDQGIVLKPLQFGAGERLGPQERAQEYKSWKDQVNVQQNKDC